MSAASLASYLVGKLKSDEVATGDMSSQGRGSPTPRLTAVWRAKSIPFDIPDANTSFRNEGSLLRLLRTKSMPLLGIGGTTPPRMSTVPPQGSPPARSQSPSPVRRPTSHVVYSRNMSSGHLSDASESTVPSVATPPPTPRSPSPSGPRRRSASDGHLWQRRKKQMRRATDKAAVQLPSVKNLRGKFDEKFASPTDEEQLPDESGQADGNPQQEDSETDEGQEGRRASRHYSLVRREVKTPERGQPPKPAVTPANVRKLLEKFESPVQDEDEAGEVFSESRPQDLRSKCRSEAALKTTASEVRQEDQIRRRTSLTGRQRAKNHRRSKSEPDPSAVLQFHSMTSPPSVKKLKMMFERGSQDKGDSDVSREGTPERTVPFQRQKEKTPEPPQPQVIPRKATEEAVAVESRAADTVPAVKVSRVFAAGTPSVRSLRQRFEQGASARSLVKTADEEVAPSTHRPIAQQLKTPFEKSERQKSRSVSPEKEIRQSLTSVSSASVKNLMRQFETLSPAEAHREAQGNVEHDLRSPRSPPPIGSQKKFQAPPLDHATREAQQDAESGNKFTLEVEMDSARQHRRLRRQSHTSSSESSSGDEWKEEEELRRRKVMEQEKVRKEQEEAKERQRIQQEEKMRQEKIELERIEKEKEKERIMQEKEKREKERMDREREAREKEEERRTKEILEKERKAKEKLEEERKMRERAEQERLAKEEKERKEKEKLEEERKIRERAEQERLAKEEKERKEKEKLEEERKVRERAEQERQVKEEKERKEKEKLEEERKIRERAEQERQAKEEKERKEKEKLEQERKIRERAEQERLAKEERERQAKEKLEEERKVRERAEQERLAKEENERKERELLQQKIKEKEEAELKIKEKERREKEKKEREEEERKEKERAKYEKEMREKAEEERKEREKIEKERAQEEEKRKKREREEAERLQNEQLERQKKEEERKSREETSSSSDEEMPKRVGGEGTHDNHENKPDKATDRKVHEMIDRFTHLGQRSDELPPDDTSPPQGKASSEQRVDRLIDQFTNLRDADLEKDTRKSDGDGHEGEEGRRFSDVAALVNKFRKINERRKSSSSSESDSESGKAREKPVKEEAPIPTIPARANVPGKVRTLREDEMRFFNTSGGAAEPFMRTQSLRVKKSEQSSFSQPRFGSLRGSKSRVAVLSTSTTTNAALPHNCRRLNTDELRFFTGEVTNIYRSKTAKPRGRAGKTGRGDGRQPAVPLENALPETEEFFRIAGRDASGGEPNGRPAPGEDDSDSEPSVLRDGDDVITDSEEDLYEMDINLRSDADTEDTSDTEHHYDLDHPLSKLVYSIQGELLQPVTSEDCKEAESRCYVVFSPKSYICSSSEDEDENKTLEFTFVSQTPKENVHTPTLKENGISPVVQVQEGTLYDAPVEAMMTSTPTGSNKAGEDAHKHTEGDDHTPQFVISTYSSEKDASSSQIMDFSQHDGLTTTENGSLIDFLWETKGDSQPLEELKGFVLTDRETGEAEETGSREGGPSLLTCEKINSSDEETVKKEEVNIKKVNLLEECSGGHGPDDSQPQEDQQAIAAFLHELDELNDKPPDYKPPPPPTTLCENRYQRMDDSDSSSDSSSEDGQLSAEDVRSIEEQTIPASSFQELLVFLEGPSSTPPGDDGSPGTAKDVRDKETPSQDPIAPKRTTEDLFTAISPSGSLESALTNSFKDSQKMKENEREEEVTVEKEDSYTLSETQEVEKNTEKKENTTVLEETEVDQQAIAAFLDELDSLNFKPPDYKAPPPPKKLRENPCQRMDDSDSSSDSSSDSGSEDGRGYTGLSAEDVRSIEEQIIPEASFQGLLACPEGPSSTPPGDDGSPGTTKELRDTETPLQDTITPQGATRIQECPLTSSSKGALNKEEKDDHASTLHFQHAERQEEEGNMTGVRGEADQATPSQGEEVEDIITGREFIKFCIFSIWFSFVMYFLSDVLS